MSNRYGEREIACAHGRWSAMLLAALLLSMPATRAWSQQEAEPEEGSEEVEQEETGNPERPTGQLVVFDRLMVIGGPEQLAKVPGSAHVISRQELEQQEYFDIHRILRQVPGVNVQEEEGYGLRPNIGMRGTGVERSQNITLLEDGVLIAPAPYAAPAAYYFPVAGRMEGIEIRKGSSSIRQGPYTQGGVLNLISTSIPQDLGGSVELSGGEDSTWRLHGAVGDSRERFGWLIETYQTETDGFKRLDGGGETGFDLEDYLLKGRWNSAPEARLYQVVEVKAGKTEQLGEETYLGLTEADFERDPFRRYAASGEDLITTDHEQLVVRHYLQPRARFDLTTTAYRNDFFRNWHKLDSVLGVGVAAVLDDPAGHAHELAVLRGEADDLGGGLSVRNNRRDYYSQGIETVLGIAFGDRLHHELEAGLRYHEDEEDRFQEDDRFNMVGGQMVFAAPGVPGSQANRITQAEALAVFAQDQIAWGRWTLTPGVRFEIIDYARRDFGRDDPGRAGAGQVRTNDVDVVIPGFGVAYELAPSWVAFGGVHKGFAPPGSAGEETEAEESVNYEAGLRYQALPARLQVVGFFNDYDNLLGRDTLSGGGAGSGRLFNGGAVEVLGLEAALGYDLGRAQGWSLGVPLRVAYTFTEAEFRTSFETGFADWAPEVAAGDELPYLPAHQWAAGVGVVGGSWGVYLDASYTDEMRTAPGTGPIPAGTGTDDYLVLDLSAHYRIVSGLKVTGHLRNLTDETYIVARRPAGVRPGLPRTALLGFSWDF